MIPQVAHHNAQPVDCRVYVLPLDGESEVDERGLQLDRIDGIGVVFAVVGRGFWFGRHVGRSEDDSWERSVGIGGIRRRNP